MVYVTKTRKYVENIDSPIFLEYKEPSKGLFLCFFLLAFVLFTFKLFEYFLGK